MAKILYGVQGSGHGHAIRALTIARQFPQHDFLFTSFGAGARVLGQEFRVVEMPNPDTIYRHHRIAVGLTAAAALGFWWRYGQTRDRLLKVLEEFQPDVTLADYEFMVPRVARDAGLPCLSLDHQHVINCCRHDVPWRQRPDYWTTAFVINRLYMKASYYLIISFFQPPVHPGLPARVAPPLLRQTVLDVPPREGEHVLAYQGHPTFREFFTFLKAIPRPVTVYGFNRDDTDGNLTFKKKSETGFLTDLASCRYVVCGGGHTMTSEALYYGKPVLSFPIKNAFEQFVNALYLQRLGYGMACTDFTPRPDLIHVFESRLDEFRANIRQANFHGNPEIFALLSRYFEEKKLPSVS